MLVEVDEAVQVYREYSRIPAISSAHVLNADTAGHIRVYSEWTTRDLERQVKVKFARHHITQLDVVFPTSPTDVKSEALRRESPSGRYCAILRSAKDKKGEDKQYIEIWDDACKVQNIDVSSLNKHGKIYDDEAFGCFEWSHSESHLMYIAEKKRPTAKSYFDTSPKPTQASLEEETAVGEEFKYVDDWGEQFTGKSQSVLCVLDWEAAITSTLENLPEDVSPGQGIWCKDDEGIVCIGYYNGPYRLGLVYCPIRRSSIFYIDLKTSTCTTLGSTDQSVRCPRFSPDFSKLIWLENQEGGPHFQCAKLMMCDWSNKGVVTVLDVIRKADADKFQGVFTLYLPHRCWCQDSRRILFTTMWRSKLKAIVVDVVEGAVTELPSELNSGCMVVKDVHKDLVIVSCSSPNQPNHLVIGQIPGLGKEKTVAWTHLDNDPPHFLDFTWRVFTVQPPEDQCNKKYGPIDFECILLEPTQQNIEKKPSLIVYPHGGPHSVFSADFMLYPSALCKLGYAVLLVNYRGSPGFGQDSVDSLLGNIGTQDVNDVQQAVKVTLEMEVTEPENVYVMGGSHGGFLVAHLIGQFPGFYKAVCCRNPVINLLSMVNCTDIPDWTYVECGQAFDLTQTGNSMMLEEMWKRSPIRYVDQICTPVLIMLGLCDRRVPHKQGHELWKALRARNVPVRLLVYPDNDHPINKVDAEADAFINIYKWLKSNGDLD